MTLEFTKNKVLLEAPLEDRTALATYRIATSTHDKSIVEEIALGQSLGAWEPRLAPESRLKEKVARIIDFKVEDGYYFATIAFPHSLWLGRLNFLLTHVFGKMSFYNDIQLWDLELSDSCYDNKNLTGPLVSTEALREKTGAAKNAPLLMGILKPNVAMDDDTIVRLYSEAAEAGIHLLKDDEIRHDINLDTTLKRVEAVAKCAQKNKFTTLYVAHLQLGSTLSRGDVKRFEDAGAMAFLVEPWTSGLQCLQDLRSLTKLPIAAHPALAGAFGFDSQSARIHPRVTLGRCVRAAGADLSLFPSPYGKIGLTKHDALAVSQACTTQPQKLLATTPVPSAGIKPEHGPQARADFGNDFILNAGTAIFSGSEPPRANIQRFRQSLYGGVGV